MRFDTASVVDRHSTLLLQVHESLCNMTELTGLRLQGCEIETVSPSISNLQKLKVLDLSHNHLAEVEVFAGPNKPPL